MRKLLLTSFILVFGGCTLFEPEPANNPESNFELFWKDFDELYSLFGFQNYDWDSVYRACRPGVDARTSNDSLFRMFKAMVKPFKDAHISLNWKDKGLSYAYPLEPANFVTGKALTKQIPNLKDDGPFAYGHTSDQIGYLLVKTFSSNEPSFQMLDNIMASFEGMRAVIVDVRVNGGGSTANSDFVASRFADQERISSYIRWKAGSGHDAFADYEAFTVRPKGTTFTKPVVLLIGRSTYSAAEDFVCRMKVMPHVTLVGDRTGGGSGNPMRRFLPNGMTFNVPRWIQYDANKEPYERKGIPPSVAIPLTEEDRNALRDGVLLKAIEWINSKY